MEAQLKEYIGAEACRACHSAQFERQSATGHAGALRRAIEHPLASRFTRAKPVQRAPNFHFKFVKIEDGIRVRADDGRYVTELPVEWAFGAGEHAVTFVSHVNDEFYLEHSFSYYPGAGAFALTPRHEALRVSTLHEAMGQPIPIWGARATTISACFGCHSTGPVFFGGDGVVSIREPGVRCEVCHGAGGAHRSAAAAGDVSKARRLIGMPGALSAVNLNRLCGECHRSLVEGETFNWDSLWSARHQPPYLARSRCFQASGALSCLTCHNPHERVRRDDAAYYRGKCVGCHQTGRRPPARTCLAQKEADCAGCHMPLVTAGANMDFRNHWIGIYTKGVALKPAR